MSNAVQASVPDDQSSNGDLLPAATPETGREIPDEEAVKGSADATINDAMAGLDPLVQSALRTGHDAPAPLPVSVEAKGGDWMYKQVEGLDFAAKYLEKMASEKMSDHERNKVLVMIHKILMMLITLTVIFSKKPKEGEQVNLDGPALQVLKRADQKNTEATGITEANAAGFNFGRALKLVLASPRKYAIRDVQHFCNDLIKEGNAVLLLESLEVVEPAMRAEIVMSCLSNDYKGKYVVAAAVAAATVEQPDEKLMQALLETKNKEAVQAALNILVKFDDNKILEIAKRLLTAKRFKKQTVTLDLLMTALLTISDPARKTRLILTILAEHPEELKSPHRYLLESSGALHDLMPDWLEKVEEYKAEQIRKAEQARVEDIRLEREKVAASQAVKPVAQNDTVAVTKKRKELTPERKEELFSILKARFQANENRHKNIEWIQVEKRLQEAAAEKLWSLNRMEETGGEPDVVGKEGDKFIFEDRAKESPIERRNLCYDKAGEDDAKKRGWTPAGNAVDMAAEMGIEIQDEARYRDMQKEGKFDMHTWSWLKTPDDKGAAGVALYGYRGGDGVNVFGSSPYDCSAYGGFRGLLRV